MSYASDFGRAERAYYTPTEHAEGEYEGTKTVYCRNEGCKNFEYELDADILISYCGNSGSGTYICPECDTHNEFEFDLDEDEIGGYHDTDEDWRWDR